MTWDVVIPAGGTIDAEFAEAIGSPHRALALLGPDNRPVLQHVVNTLRDTDSIDRIICVAPPPVTEVIRGVDCWLPAGDSGTDNIRAGLAEAKRGKHMLVCASDLPLMTPESIRAFLTVCRAEVEVTVGLVAAGDYNQAFPEAPPSEFVHLADAGPVTLGGLFAVRPNILIRQDALFRRFFGARKDQWRMAGLLGPRLLWQYATKTLRLRDIVSRAEILLGGTVQIIPNTAPDLAYDIDTCDDYTYARTLCSRTDG